MTEHNCTSTPDHKKPMGKIEAPIYFHIAGFGVGMLVGSVTSLIGGIFGALLVGALYYLLAKELQKIAQKG